MGNPSLRLSEVLRDENLYVLFVGQKNYANGMLTHSKQ